MILNYLGVVAAGRLCSPPGSKMLKMVPNFNWAMNALGCLRTGKVILLQTDTIWGLSCDATNGDAAREVFRLKGRPESAPALILASGFDMAGRYAVLRSDMDYEKLKGISLILEYRGGSGLAPQAHREGKVCIRVPDSPFLCGLIAEFGRPLLSTSANRHGSPSPASEREISNTIRESVCSVAHNPDNKGEETCSTILDLTGYNPKIVREGKNIEKISEPI